MRIALCLSGQARFVEQGYREVIKPLIFDGKSVDVFIHTWDIDQSQIGNPFMAGKIHPVGSPVAADLIDYTIDLYRPVKHKREYQKPFPIVPWNDRHMPGFFSENAYSMFYSIYQANLLKILYEDEHNFKYDWVIRSRFDVQLNTQLDFDAFDPQAVNVPNICFDPVNGYVDCFSFSNSYNMDVYANTYN